MNYVIKRSYDHHQPGFNIARETGIKYASAGLVWRDYGRQLIKLVLKKHFSGFNCDIDSIFDIFDDAFIVPVDCEDNGEQKGTHCFSFINSFLPLWFQNKEYNFNYQFEKALLTTMEVLEQELKATIGKKISEKIIVARFTETQYFSNGILEIPSQTMDWKETVINLNSDRKTNKINFVIFPYPSGGWAAQCVPPSMEEEFKQRIPFPKHWAGQSELLPEINGIAGATFCHNGRFFVRGETKEDVVAMCDLATELQYLL